MGLPLAPVIPSQSPVPVGLIPASSPNSGIKSELTSRRIGADITDSTITLEVARTVAANFNMLENVAVEGMENVVNEWLVEKRKRVKK